MNAYELANELSEFMTEDEYTKLDKTIFKAVTMLRQQADRIAHLEMLLANRNEVIDKLDLTTPQIKELSDEEIYKLAGEFWIEGSFDDGELDYVGFARAIEERHGIK